MLATTVVTAAFAAWFSGGSLAVVTRFTASRVALLPGWVVPAWSLVVASALGLLARKRRLPVAPLLVLLVLVLPWLPFPVPAAFLLWTGPIVSWVWIGALVALAIAAWPTSPAGGAGLGAIAGLGDAFSNPRRAPLVALCLAFLVYAGAGWRLTEVLPSGDEPNYLIITQSLLKDGDLQIENNHRQGDYKAYYPGLLRPDFLRRGVNRQIYSIHAPGVSALVAPAFAVAGYPGVVVFLALLSALATWLVWRAAYRLTRDIAASWFGWATVTIGAPFFFHAFTVYPDGTGAAIVMLGVAALVELDLAPGDRDGPRAAVPGRVRTLARWALLGAALAALPWLHTRYAGAAAVLGACIGLRLLGRRQVGAMAALLVVPALSAGAWFSYFHVIYGRWSPAAPYGHYTQSSLANIPTAVPALLFDQQYGMIPNAPVYALGLVGLAMLLRRRPRLTVELILLIGSYLALVAAYHMWWGGRSAPARFAVPVLLPLGVTAAFFWMRVRAAGRAAGLIALALSVLITGSLVLVDSGWMVFNDRDGVSRWLEWLTPLVDLPRALPSFLRGPRQAAFAAVGVWAATMSLAFEGLRRLAARRISGSDQRLRLTVAAPVIFAGAAMVAVSTTWAVSGANPIAPTTSQLELMRRFDPVWRPLGVLWRPLGIRAPGEIVSRLAVGVSSRRSLPPGGILLALADVPAGTYRLSPTAVARGRGVVEVRISRSREAVERWTLGPEHRGLDRLLRLPASVNAVTVTGDADAVRTMTGMTLDPVAVVPRAQRVARANARGAQRYGDLVVFAFDDHVFLEGPGLWVEGRADARLVISPDTAGPVPVLLRNGPVGNRVSLRTGGWDVAADLEPNEVRVIEVPVDPGKGAALLAIRTTEGFRPADVDRSSADRRYLGVWIEASVRR